LGKDEIKFEVLIPSCNIYSRQSFPVTQSDLGEFKCWRIY